MDFFDRKYLEICSERTLQSNKKGFFLDFSNGLIECVGKKWVQQVFGKLTSDKERIRTIYNDSNVKDYVVEFLGNVQEIYRGKSREIAEKCLKEAENQMKNQNTVKASGLYSQAILKSPHNNNLLALATFGRSKALIELGEFNEALSDLQQCLKLNLPQLKGEILRRQSICYKNLGEERKAKLAYDLASKLLQQDKLNDLNEIFDKSLKPKKNKVKFAPQIDGDSHKNFRNISAKISIKQSPDLGRYAVANKSINTGETIVVEEPYVACLLPEKFGTHCHHCFKRLVAPVGCPDCCGVAFCSNDCQNIAVLSYHKYECKFLDLLIGSGMSILSHSALRMVTQNNLEKNLEIYQNRTKISVYKLCTNSNRRNAEDFLQRTLMAGFLLRILQKSNYFGQNNSAVIPDENELKIGELLLFHLQILQFNAHEIYETLQSKEHKYKGSVISYIGVGLYPSVALFNHGCYPGVTRYFSGKTIVINTLRPIEPGQMIEENYGPMFTWRSLAERQKTLLGRYWFKCECKACKEDWPTMKNLDNAPERIKCTNPSCDYIFTLPVSSMELKCPSCLQIIDLCDNITKLQLCKSDYDKGISLLEDNDEPAVIIKTVCPVLDDFHRISAPPHKTTHLVQETLRMCLAENGNTFECSSKNCTTEQK